MIRLGKKTIYALHDFSNREKVLFFSLTDACATYAMIWLSMKAQVERHLFKWLCASPVIAHWHLKNAGWILESMLKLSGLARLFCLLLITVIGFLFVLWGQKWRRPAGVLVILTSLWAL